MKTRYENGAAAFAAAAKLRPEMAKKLRIQKAALTARAKAIALAKKVYIKLFLRK